MAQISDLPGKTLSSVEVSEDRKRVRLLTADRREFIMRHDQDCCESVGLHDVCGDLDDLIGTPVIRAEERSSKTDPEDCRSDDPYRESFTWTFYELATVKGSVTLRWLGESNGCYSEGVDLDEVAS